MVTYIGINFGSGNGLVPDGTKPLPEQMLILASVASTRKHISGSTLAQVMAWCLMAPNHYLNQCWSWHLWHPPESNFATSAHELNPLYMFAPQEQTSVEILNEIQTFSLMKMQLEMLSAKCHPFCLAVNVLSYLGSCLPNTMMRSWHGNTFTITMALCEGNHTRPVMKALMFSLMLA